MSQNKKGWDVARWQRPLGPILSSKNKSRSSWGSHGVQDLATPAFGHDLHMPSCQSAPHPVVPARVHLGLPGIPSRLRLSSLPRLLVKAPYPVLGLLVTGAPRTRPRLPSRGPAAPGITGPWSSSELTGTPSALGRSPTAHPQAASELPLRHDPRLPGPQT